MLARDGTKHLNDAVKSKIITLKCYSTLNNKEISEDCDCSVSKRPLLNIFHIVIEKMRQFHIYLLFVYQFCRTKVDRRKLFHIIKLIKRDII